MIPSSRRGRGNGVAAAAAAPHAAFQEWGRHRMDLQWVQRARGAQRETRMIESLMQELGVDEGCTVIAHRVRAGQIGVHKALPVAVCFSHAKLIAVCRDELIGPRQAANILCSSVRAGLFQSYCEQVVSHIIGDYRSSPRRTVCGLPLSSLAYLCTFLPDASLACLRLVSRSCYVAATHAVAQRPFPCTLTVVLEARGRRPQQTAASGFVHSTLGRDHTLPALLHYLHTDRDMAQFAGDAGGVGFEGAPEGVAAAAAAAAAAGTGAPAPAAPTYFVAAAGVSVVLPMAVVALRNVGGLRGEGGLGRAEVAAGRIATRLVERVVAEWEHALEATGGEGAVRRDVLESLLWYLDDDGVRGGAGEGGGDGTYEVPLEVTRHLLTRTVPLLLPLFRPCPLGGADRAAQALLVAEGLEALCRWCCRLRQTRLLVDVFATPALAGVLGEPLRQSRRRRDAAAEEEDDDELCLSDVMPFLFGDAVSGGDDCREGLLPSFLQLAALYKQPDSLRLGLSLLEEGGGGGGGGADNVRAAFGVPDAATGSALLHFLFEPVKGKQGGGGGGEGAVACLRLLLPHLVSRPELLLTKTAQRRPPVCALLEGVAGVGRHLPGAPEMLQALKDEGCVKGSLPLYWCMEALHALPPSAAAQVEELFCGLVDAGCAASASLGTGVVLAHLEAAAAKPNGLCKVAALCSDEGCMTQAADSDLSTARCCRLKTMRVLQELAVSTTCMESPTSASVPDDWEAEA